MPKKILGAVSGLLTGFVLLLTGCAPAMLSLETEELLAASGPQATSRALPSKVEDGVILHAFMWKFADIQAALPTIAAKGYKAVQVSPIQGTKTTDPNTPWYMLYQPTNYNIGNAQLGSEAQFTALCSAANSYGIKIIVDAVLNHVADNGNSGQFDPNVDPTIKAHPEWFHNLGTIDDYRDRYKLTQKNLGNGPDWATQRSDVQSLLLAFLNKAVAAGAGGFRFDAAKHIETNGGEDAGRSWAGTFWDTILGSGLNNRTNLYLYGEVIPDLGHNSAQYQTYYDITAHPYIWTVGNAIDAQNLTGIQPIVQYDYNLAPAKALVYAENHDTYNHGETNGFSYNKRLWSYAIMIARAGVTPLVLDRPTDDIWSDATLAEVNHFRNAMVGQAEYLRYPANPVLIIERGTAGMVIVNVSGGSYGLNSATNLAAGTYTNKTSVGGTFTVSGGTVSGTVPGNSVVVLYNGTTPPPGSYTSVYPSMNLRGSMNGWTSTPMTLTANNTWQVTVSLTGGTAYSYKYDAYGNWASSTNWGDNNADGVGDAGGNNIVFTPAASGTYTFTFNDGTRAYSVTAASTTVATPTFNPAAGAVSSGTVVTISSATPGSTIYYTTNGSTPTTSSPSGSAGSASASVTVAAALTIKAIAVKSGSTTSSAASAAYTIATGTPAQFKIIFKNNGSSQNISFPGDANNWSLTANTLAASPSAAYTITIPSAVTTSKLAQGSNASALELKIVNGASYASQWGFSSWTLGPGLSLGDSGRQITISCTDNDEVTLTIDVGTTSLSVSVVPF